MFLAQNEQREKRGRKPLDRRRLVDGAPRRVPGVGEMTELHHEICRHVLLGKKNVEIASMLGCTPQTVSNVRNSPIVKHRLRELSAARDVAVVNFAAEVQARAQRAFEILDEALLDETGEVPLMMRLKEANNILDRVERVEGIGQRNVHLHAHLSMDDIEELKRRALAAGVASGQVVDVPVGSGANCTIATPDDENISGNSSDSLVAAGVAVEGGDSGGGADSRNRKDCCVANVESNYNSPHPTTTNKS